MFLAFKLSDLITVPFGYILDVLYRFSGNYGTALILFAVVVYMALLPATAKSKKSMMKMSRLTPLSQEIQQRYKDDPQRQNEAIQKLYKDEGVSMGGGCLWSLLPMLILFPLYTVVRQPITYLLHQSVEVAEQIVSVIRTANPDLFSNSNFYDQLIAAQHIPTYVAELQAAGLNLSEATLAGVNFNFFGIDIGSIPSFAFWSWGSFSWAYIGAFLLPVLSAGSQVLSMWVSQKMNDSVVTDKNGVQDDETAKQSQQAQTTKTMMWMMPLMSLWFGFSIPAALSLYWLVGGLVRMVQDAILTQRYRKIYDEEDALRLQRAMELERIEAEKERIRAQRRAENPDGQTQNTSKKKLQKAEKERTAAEKAAAAKEYAAKKGIVPEEDDEVQQTLSGIADRPYCKGRAYVANRYHRED